MIARTRLIFCANRVYKSALNRDTVFTFGNWRRRISLKSLSNMEKSKARLLSFTVNTQYEEAIVALNGLQSNSETIEKLRKKPFEDRDNRQNVIMTQKYLQRIGLSLDVMDKLSIIHIAGTKGKGSTCAFIESILKEHGFKTGFFSSPHLVAVRERIRINGLPISKKEFSYHFWDVYNKLSVLKEHEKDMPAYFKFLTVLAFNIFLHEEVDVAIIEVGIGGEYDCTNIVRKPVVCGITSLDIDHTSMLGNTIEEIAWNKAGIIKPGIPVFTVPQQPVSALKVLQERAAEKNSELIVVPALENYEWGGKPIQLGLCGYVQFLNASLALQISNYWMGNKDRNGNKKKLLGLPFELSEIEVSSLANVIWPGRSQILDTDIATFFLDGAHTCSSIQNCIEWFSKVSLQFKNERGGRVCRILIFNLTGDRDCESMLELLYPCNFDLVIFTTNIVSKDMAASSDQTNYTVSEASQIQRCTKLLDIWCKLKKSSINTNFSNSTNENSTFSTNKSHSHIPKMTDPSNLTCVNELINTINFDSSVAIFQADQLMFEKSNCMTFPCIKNVLDYLSTNRQLSCENVSLEENKQLLPEYRTAVQVHVLVTGSLHLVGGFLAILDPNLSYSSQSVRSLQESIEEYVRRK